MIENILQKWLDKNGIYAVDLAKVAGISAPTICSLVYHRHANPRLDTIRKLSEATGISRIKLVNYFFALQEQNDVTDC